MTSELAGNQWNEGDVSCSVVRRVALPDAFFAIDGLLETTLTVLTDMGIFENAIEAELQRNLPFLATTKILMAAIKKGVGREVAHEAIKTHSLAASKNVRDGKENDLLEVIRRSSSASSFKSLGSRIFFLFCVSVVAVSKIR